MTPLRLLGLFVVVFVVALPVTSLTRPGSSAGTRSAPGSEDGEEKEDKDDPVVDVLCLKGLQETSNGNYSKAIAIYTKAIERDPNYSFAYIGRGDAYRANGDLGRAMEDYEHAARLDPDNEAARERLEDARKARG